MADQIAYCEAAEAAARPRTFAIVCYRLSNGSRRPIFSKVITGFKTWADACRAMQRDLESNGDSVIVEEGTLVSGR